MYFPNFFFIFAKIKIKLPMIYKLDNGGVIKLQKAGSVPEYGNIEQIAKYNREHGTHF